MIERSKHRMRVAAGGVILVVVEQEELSTSLG